MDDPLDLAQLRAHLPYQQLGDPLVYAPSIPSTNALALQLMGTGQGHGTLVLTDAQPEGRGRQGRRWISLPNQQILMSLILEPTFAPHWLVMAAALALVDALRAAGVAGEQIGLKWPNDVLLNQHKVAGILIETTGLPGGRQMVVLGMGINVNGSLADWPEIRTTATTIAEVLGHPLPREPLLLDLVHHLGDLAGYLASGGAGATRAVWQSWRGQLTTLGQRATVHQTDRDLVGTAEDVADDGALILRLDDGTRQTILWGDVEAGG